MSMPAATKEPRRACRECLRRSWLLGRLTAGLDYRCRDVHRLLDVLALDDHQLLAALAGSRSTTLNAEYAGFDPRQAARRDGVECICHHDHGYPLAADDPGAPRMLNVLGGLGRLRELVERPVVAILGTRKASDYGVEIARSLGRGLAASGVTVVSGLIDRVAVAAHSGALDVGAPGLAVLGGGLDAACPPRRRSILDRLRRTGCVVSELPCGCEGRRWGPLAGERIVARLSEVIVVVEADESPRELAGAAIARSLGRTVAAVPGRVTSPGSRGTNALLIGGARLVRGPQDVLELLNGSWSAAIGEHTALERLEPRLAEILEDVGAGRDTPEKLIGAADDAGEVLLALSELELRGLLTRGDGGRYVPRGSLSVNFRRSSRPGAGGRAPERGCRCVASQESG
jgi:DNA processing protein